MKPIITPDANETSTTQAQYEQHPAHRQHPAQYLNSRDIRKTSFIKTLSSYITKNEQKAYLVGIVYNVNCKASLGTTINSHAFIDI